MSEKIFDLWKNREKNRILSNRLLRQKKNQYCLKNNINELINISDINNFGFFTITFPIHLDFSKKNDMDEAQRIFRKMYRNLFNKIFDFWVRAIEPQKTGRIHYHLLVKTKLPVFKNFQIISEKKYLYSPELKKIWDYILQNQTEYGYGRCELLPVRHIDRVGDYLSSYFTKIDNLNCDFKFRRIQYSKNFPRNYRINFCWSDSSNRLKISEFLKNENIKNYKEVEKKFGKNWYRHLCKKLKLYPYE